MNIKELKETIADVPDDVQVRLITDHGHVPMRLTSAGCSYLEEDKWMGEEIDENELHEYDNPFKIFILEGF